MTSWTPKYSISQTDKLLTAPGSPFELQNRVIDGRVVKVYKNLYPSMRAFWLWVTNEHADKTYVVYEEQRYSYRETLDLTAIYASVFREKYGIQKGDRVAICSRNYPSYYISLWACHLIGAVPVLVNAWLPIIPLKHCLALTDPKLIILDCERADLVEPTVSEFKASFVVLESHEGKGKWKGMENLNALAAQYNGDSRKVIDNDPGVVPEDNAMVLFTSGTTGMPKGVLSTQRMFLSVLGNSATPTARALLRHGEKFPPDPVSGPQRGYLLPTPIFHVTGTSVTLSASLNGSN